MSNEKVLISDTLFTTTAWNVQL